ncbi:unnamed protein product, partial [Prorocentrum cordatum]
KITAGVWIAITPDLELVRHNLLEQRHIVLDRNSMFPAAQRAQTYGFDPVPRAELLALRRQAAVQAAILGDDDQDMEIENNAWVIAETDHLRFAQVLSDPEVQQATLGQSKGVALVNSMEVSVARIQTNQLEAWKASRKSGTGDLRVLGDHRGASGRRHLALSEAVSLMRETTFDGWIMLGPRVAKEWLTSVRNGPGDLTSHHGQWVRLSGISEFSAVAHIHYVLCEAVRLTIQTDQLDVTHLVSCELIMRRICQDETAVSRNPRHPDYGGLDIVLHAPTTEQGQASTNNFTGWVTSRLKDLAAIFKQTRLWNEEQRALQEWVLGSIVERVDAVWPPPPGLAAEGAARELLATKDRYSQEPKHLAPFDLTKLKVLYELGLIAFRRRPRARAAVFFVKKKKPGENRMIVDARQANACHRAPPTARLGSAGALADLDFSAGGGSFDGAGGVVGWGPHGGEADVEDCFYSFAIDGLSEWFGFDDPLPVTTIRGTSGIAVGAFWDPDLNKMVHADDGVVLYPSMRALCMGWSWALFFAQEAVSSMTCRALQPRSSAEPATVKERRPAPDLSESSVLGGVYVDNITVAGRTATLAREHGRLRNKASRIWRFDLATRAPLARGKMRGEHMEVWLGHAISLLMLARPGYAALPSACRFAESARGRRAALPREVKQELRIVVGLVWLTEIDLAAPYAPRVHASDSSDLGHGLMYKRARAEELRADFRWKEKVSFGQHLRGPRVGLVSPSDVADMGGYGATDLRCEPQDAGASGGEAGLRWPASSPYSGAGPATALGQWMQAKVEDGAVSWWALWRRRFRSRGSTLRVLRWFPSKRRRWPGEHINVKGVLGLFSGEGGLSEAFEELNLRTFPCMDIKDGPTMTLDPARLRALEAVLRPQTTVTCKLGCAMLCDGQLHAPAAASDQLGDGFRHGHLRPCIIFAQDSNLEAARKQAARALRAAVRDFFDWATRAEDLKWAPESKIDQLMCKYFDDLMSDARHPAEGRYALSGFLAFFPRADVAKSDRLSGHVDAAVALAIQLDAYLRPSEICELRWCSVVRPSALSSRLVRARWVVVIGNSDLGETAKTGESDDTVVLNLP